MPPEFAAASGSVNIRRQLCRHTVYVYSTRKSTSMVWFVCDDCGDTIKKPKVPQHLQQCSASRFTCLDCSRAFDRHTVKSHATCVTEVDKYAKGATKPGGYAAQGFYTNGNAAAAPAQPQAAVAQEVDTAFLSQRPPWKCSVCNVQCTSQDTLLGHAQGVKHRRRAKAASQGKAATTAIDPAEPAEPAVPAALQTPAAQTESLPTAGKHSMDPSAAPQSRKAKKQKTVISQAAHANSGPSTDANLEADASAAQSNLKQVKWKKLAAQVLEASSGSVKLSKLQKKLRDMAKIDKSLAAEADAAILARLKGSSQFVINRKSVGLAELPSVVAQ